MTKKMTEEEMVKYAEKKLQELDNFGRTVKDGHNAVGMKSHPWYEQFEQVRLERVRFYLKALDKLKGNKERYAD